MSAIKFAQVGSSTYELYVDDVLLGEVWRTRIGWSGRTRPKCTLVVRDYPGSRAVAAANVVRAAQDEREAFTAENPYEVEQEEIT